MSAPLILATNSIKDTGYNVANSLRFNDGDSPQLTRVNSSDGNLKNWTFSVWVKRSSGGATKRLLHCRNSGGSQFASIFFNSSDQLEYSSSDGSNSDNLVTNRVFRDFSAWYNIVVVWDSDNSTSSDRIKFFVNGSRETSFATSDFPALNQESMMSKGTAASTIGLGFQSVANSEHFDGYMCEAVFLDSTASTDASEFGEFNEDSPTIWQPIDVSGLTFGSHGYYLDFEDSSALGDDVSGNNNDFTPSNLAATDQSTDTCTNNFATVNALDPSAGTLTDGNLRLSASTSPRGTFGFSQGKWYWEIKLITQINDQQAVGICNETFTTSTEIGTDANSWSYIIQSNANNGQTNHNGSLTQFATLSANDIINVAVDMDNQAIYFGKNGTYQNSGNPASGSSKTGAIYTNLPTSGFVFPCFRSTTKSGTDGVIEVNFGNPPFTISSSNTDSEGFGNFEYAVPSGYFALCTKNLSEYGG